TLPPGLYEAVITDTHPEMPGLDLVDGRYLIQFQPRTLDDILKLDDGRGDERAFEVVDRVSQINQGLYDTFVSPVVKAFSSEAAARVTRDANPARMERWAFSDLNPWMWWVKSAAEWVRANRQPVAPDNAFVQAEKKVSAQIEEALDRYRDARDAASERLFKALYESPWLAAAVGILPGSRSQRGAPAPTWEREELKRLKLAEIEDWVETGTLADAWARLLLYVGREDRVGDERPFNLLRKMIEETKPENVPSLAVLKAALKRQAFVLALHEERAIAALPRLAPDINIRRRGYEAARKIVRARGELTPRQVERLRRVAKLLELETPAQELKSA
ncbi:MAG TPA: DUF3141 domain-containing protein, partial [Burkholderiales bacterium]|nr:DUF3141 domain-containing protein [Burkholderiales bacterium]